MTERLWYAVLDGKQAGPFGDAQLRDLVAHGRMHADTLVWCAPMKEWTRAANIPGLVSTAPHPPPPPLPAAAHGGGNAQPLELTAGVWPLLGRSLLVVLGQVLVIPSPWTLTGYYRWLVPHIRLPIRQQAEFTGMPLDIWYIIMASALCAYAGSVSGWLELLSFPLNVLFSLLILRWVLAKLAWEGQTAPLQFVGDYWRLLGWGALLVVSTITIIGWAWVAAAMTRWICRHLEGSSKQLSFVGGGWGVLWRSILFGFSCLFIIPIPWTLHWYLRWITSQFCLGERT